MWVGMLDKKSFLKGDKNMAKKLICMDLDGTIIDHTQNIIPPSTKSAIKKLQDNGHIVAIATGRPPSLFYGIEETLNIDTYIASNGRYVVSKGQELLHDYIDKDVVERFIIDMEQRGLDVGFETRHDYVVHSKNTALVDDFSNHFHLHSPEIIENYHKTNDVLQMILFTDNHNIQDIEAMYPELDFNISCRYGIDINAQGGMKEIGIDVLQKHFNIPNKDIIAIGDGYNDIGMIKRAHIGIAMGNACQPLKDAADYITEPAHENGIENILKKLNVI